MTCSERTKKLILVDIAEHIRRNNPVYEDVRLTHGLILKLMVKAILGEEAYFEPEPKLGNKRNPGN